MRIEWNERSRIRRDTTAVVARVKRAKPTSPDDGGNAIRVSVRRNSKGGWTWVVEHPPNKKGNNKVCINPLSDDHVEILFEGSFR